VFLQVADKGKGFTQKDIDKDKNVGLSSMRERAESIGGSLTVDSSPGEGTRITVEVTSVSKGDKNE
jgi:signal transduction histidine kinase